MRKESPVWRENCPTTLTFTGIRLSPYQENNADTTQVGIHLVHQVFHIRNVAHPTVFPQFLGYPLQRIGIGIVRGQLYLQGCREGVEAQKLRRVTAQLLNLLLLGLFLTDIVDIVGIRTMVQVTT